MKLLPMIIIAILAALLSSMNIWVAKFEHVRIHLNDIYMACLMVPWMTLLDSLYDYERRKSLLIPSIVFILLFTYLIREQVLIDDTQFMRGMIPHHSMSILMCEKIRDKTQNDNIRNFADNIIKSQNKEIEYMEKLGY
jgi:hypothetical protein